LQQDHPIAIRGIALKRTALSVNRGTIAVWSEAHGKAVSRSE
jgi:hypothetical protein